MQHENSKDAAAEAVYETLASHLESSVDRFRPDTRISSIALDSIDAIIVLGELQERLKLDLPPILFWQSETLGEFVEHIRALSQKA